MDSASNFLGVKPPVKPNIDPTNTVIPQKPQTEALGQVKKVGEPAGDVAQTFAPKINPVIDPAKTAQDAEWAALRKQAAGNLALAQSESDIAKASSLQAVRENAYRSGAAPGSAAYGAMEQRAIDEANQVRMGAVNEAAQENMAAERSQLEQDTQRSQALSDEYFRNETARIEAEINDPTTSPERRLQLADYRDNLNAGHYGSGIGSQAPIGSYRSQVEAESLSNVSAGSTALLPEVQSILGLQGDQANAASNAANLNGILTPEQISQYRSFLTDSRVQKDPGIVNTYVEKVKRGDFSDVDWDLLMKSPQWSAEKDNLITHTRRPKGKVAVGETILLPNSQNPLQVINNPSGEGFYAKDLVTGKTILVKNWERAGVASGNLTTDWFRRGLGLKVK